MSLVWPRWRCLGIWNHHRRGLWTTREETRCQRSSLFSLKIYSSLSLLITARAEYISELEHRQGRVTVKTAPGMIFFSTRKSHLPLFV